MRAAVIAAAGESPFVGDLPDPDPDALVGPEWPVSAAAGRSARGSEPDGLSLIAVRTAALNPLDLHVAAGRFFQGPPQVPYAPGVEGAGVVIQSRALAPGTRVRFEVGHPGYGTNGSLAEKAVAPDSTLVELSDGLDDEAAAAAGVVGITAARALDLLEVRKGDRVLVLGATGSIGQVAVQLAKAAGAHRVVAAGRDAGALARACELGADAAVTLDGRETGELAAAFREAAGGHGVDAVVDPLWGAPAMAALAAGSFGVRLVNFGQAAGADTVVSSVPLRNNRATIRGISTAMDPPELRRDRCARVLELLEAGRLTVDRDVVGLDRVGEAWKRQARSPNRKLVVQLES
jgi:NADPH:quinone reductase-like Zn-dependent oxidoreductase